MKVERNRSVLFLVSFHVVFGAGCAIAERRFSGNQPVFIHIVGVCAFASAVSQAMLLALWGVFSSLSPWERIVGVAAGFVYLVALFGHDSFNEALFVFSLIIALATPVLVAVKLGFICLRRQAEATPATESETIIKLRYSLKTLMLVVAGAAMLLAGWREIRTSSVLGGGVFVLSFVILGLIDLWAVVGDRGLEKRGTLTLILSVFIGGYVASATDSHIVQCAYDLLGTIMYSLLMLGSLLFLRSCGYYFVRKGQTEQSSLIPAA